MTVRTPQCTHHGLGSFPFARRYLGNRCFFLFLSLLRCFSSGGSLYIPMYSVCSDWGLLSQVSPFRNLRIIEYLLLTAAYRSLLRLSSALSAKASTLRSNSLYLVTHFHVLLDLNKIRCIVHVSQRFIIVDAAYAAYILQSRIKIALASLIDYVVINVHTIRLF